MVALVCWAYAVESVCGANGIEGSERGQAALGDSQQLVKLQDMRAFYIFALKHLPIWR